MYGNNANAASASHQQAAAQQAQADKEAWWANAAAGQTVPQTIHQPDQPISARVDVLVKQASDMAAQLAEIANRIAGPTPDLACLGEASAHTDEPPLTRKIDRLASAMQRIQRNIKRINGHL